MAARNEGFLVVTDRCTFIERDGDREFLAWPADRTTWDPAIAAIVFRRFSGEVVTVRNGDRVVLGGGGSSRAEDGLGGAQWASRLNWIVPPMPECLVDVRFEVSDVEPEVEPRALDALGVRWRKEAGFPSTLPFPGLGRPFDGGTRFCFNDRAEAAYIIP
jgi:hypothetical protein